MLSIISSSSVLAANEVVGKAVPEDIGVAYRGHVQNQGNMPKPEGSLVAGPEALGTRGQSLRVEGFWIELTGNVPEGANIVYEVHVQNEGWMAPVKNGNFAGTAGKSQRVESIKIRLENLPGYDVYYRGHVQNVGDIPQADGDWGWKKNGEELGTTGSSLRLEELQVKLVKQPDTSTTYDKAGTYGPKTGVDVIENDVVINTPDVVLQNLHIKGNLTIGEGVGEGDVTLNNITVDGETFVRGGGKNSIHINGGEYNKITIQQTSSGQVRIVATDAAGLEVVVSEDAKGEDIILEGAFENVQIDAPDVKISTQGETTIKEMVVAEGAKGSEITLDKKTVVNQIDVGAAVEMKGEGTIEKANVNSDNVTFEQKPKEEVIAPEVKVPPVVTPPTPPKPDPTPSEPSGPSAEDLKVAEFNNAKNNIAVLELLWKNALNLNLTGFDKLDYLGECIVVQTILDKNGFGTRAAIQAAVTEGIKLAQDDAQANAYMQALFSYTPELSAEGNIFTVTYPDKLTTAQQSLLSGLYTDLVVKTDVPLADGEVFELTVNGTTKQVSSKDLTGGEVLLSKLLGRPLVEGDLVQNQKSTLTITIKDVSTKVERYVTVCPCTSKNGEEYFKNFTNAYAIQLRPLWVAAYSDSITVDYRNSEFLFNYDAENLTAVQKQGLDGYYADTMIHLDQPLAAGESIKISGLGTEATLTSSTVMENEDRTEIRLSKLMKVALDTNNLAVNQPEFQKIGLSELKLNSAHYIWAEAVLTRGNDEIINTQKAYGTSIYPTWMAEYQDSVSTSAENAQIVVHYEGGLSDSAVTGLGDCKADVMIYLSRELEEGETLTISLPDKPEKKVILTKGMIKDSQFRLLELLGVTQNAATKSGEDIIEFSIDVLNRNIQIHANPILVQKDQDVYLNNGASLSLYQPSFKAYSDSVELSSTDDNKFLVNYKGGLSPDVQAKLAGYYADAMIYLDRALEEGETVTVKAFSKDVEISKTSPAEDSGMRSYRLSKLLDIKLGDANLAVKQNGSFEIAVIKNTLEKQLNVSTTAVLVKDGDIEYLDNYTGMSINPPGFDAYQNSVEILPDNNQGFTVTHKGGLSPDDVQNLAGLYGDTLISFDRPLKTGEVIKVSAYGAKADITKSSFTGSIDNKIGLTELLKISPDQAPLAAAQGEDIKISLAAVNLQAPISVAAWNGLVKGDGTWVYRANTGIGFGFWPLFMDAYKNNITLETDENKITVTYLDKLTTDEKLALDGYYSDAMINLSRPLAADEKVTINAFGAPMTVDRTMVTENNGTQIRLSELLKIKLGVNQLAANQTGGFDITVTDNTLKSDLRVTAEAILVKDDALHYMGKYTSLELKSLIFETAVAAYTKALAVSAADNVFTVTYAGNLSTADQAGLNGFYSDAYIYLNRSLVAGETVTVNAFGNDYIIDASKITDADNKIRLSTLLGINLGEAQLAAKQLGSFNISIVPQKLNADLEVYAQAILVKADGDITELNRGATLLVMKETDQPAPVGLTGLAPTTSENTDGMIIETTELMEYKLETAEESAYVPCTDITTMVAVPGTYVVRKAAQTESLAGATAVVTVPSWNEVDVKVEYQGFVDAPEAGWLLDRAMLETPKEDFSFDAIRVNLANAPTDAKITYQTYNGSDNQTVLGWSAPVSDGETAGTDNPDGTKNPIEAIKLKLENMPNYSVIYQVYVKDHGWQSWVRDDAMAGTEGMSLPIEAIRIRIVKEQ
ncbi:Ig domain-containing protein [Acetobacterium wieringae]|nr:Ig domain-containing protein [Acetobacterium wieringae]